MTDWFPGPSLRRRWHAVGFAVAILVGGCSGASGPPITLPAPPPGAAPQDATPVDPSVAQILEHGAGGERLQYRTAEGRSVSLALGPIYSSARGAPCRLGRLDRIEPGVLAPMSYPFCRIDNRWYEMRPVVISGY